MKTKKINEKMISKQKRGIFGMAEPYFGDNRVMGETDRNALTNNRNVTYAQYTFR